MPPTRGTIDPAMVAELADRLSNNLHVREDREEVLQSSTTSVPNAPRCTLPTQSSELPSLDIEGSEASPTAGGAELSPPITIGREYGVRTLLLKDVHAHLISLLSRGNNNNHNGISNNGAGDNTRDNPGGNSAGDNTGDDTGDDTGDNIGDNTGDDTGDNTGDNTTGDDTGDDTGDNGPGDNGPGDNGPGDNGPGDNGPGDNTSISVRIANACYGLCCGREWLDELHLHMDRVYGWAVEAGLTTDPSSLAASLRTDVVGYKMFGPFKECENRTENDWSPRLAYVHLGERLAAQILDLENYINPDFTTEVHEIKHRLDREMYGPLDAEFIEYFHDHGFTMIPVFILFCQEAGQLTANAESGDTEREDHRANISNLLLDLVHAT